LPAREPWRADRDVPTLILRRVFIPSPRKPSFGAILRLSRVPCRCDRCLSGCAFLLECRAAGIEPIDAPYTYSDGEGCEREARRSRRLGYRSKSTVTPAHVDALHRVLTLGREEVAAMRRIVAGFEEAVHPKTASASGNHSVLRSSASVTRIA
jgi:hypothetical protein